MPQDMIYLGECSMCAWRKYVLYCCQLNVLCMSVRPLVNCVLSEKAMATDSVLLPGKSHGRRSLVGCSPWVTKSRTWLSNFTFTFHFHALEEEMATHSSVLAWRIPGMGEPGGLPSMGSHGVRHNWSDLAAAAIVLFNTKSLVIYC